MGWLLDTSVAILLRDADSVADERLVELHSVPMLSIVTLIELEGGVHARPELTDKRRRAVDALAGTLGVVDFDAACLAAYRGILEAVGFSRRKIIDRMIAATALAHGLSLITLNAQDFRDIPGLRLAAW